MSNTITKPACIATGEPDVGIYVACLASYSAGTLHGSWIDLEPEGGTDREAIEEAIAWILATSPTPGAEEYAVHDSSGLPDCLSRTEWPDLDEIEAYIDALSDLPDEDDREAYRLACNDAGQVLDVDDFRDRYQGCWSSEEDYAQERAEQITETRDLHKFWPTSCIDWEQAWRELTYDGYSSESCRTGGVHIFCSR